MSDLNKVVLCLEKIKSKSLGQNPDNLKHFLLKDFSYDCEKAIKLIDEAIVVNILKSVIFNGKVAFRIIRADSNADDTIIVPETQEDNSHIVQNDVIENRNCCTETGVIKDSQTNKINKSDQSIKLKQKSPNTTVSFSNIIIQKDRKNFLKISR